MKAGFAGLLSFYQPPKPECRWNSNGKSLSVSAFSQATSFRWGSRQPPSDCQLVAEHPNAGEQN
jgi:hypothetical protein